MKTLAGPNVELPETTGWGFLGISTMRGTFIKHRKHLAFLLTVDIQGLGFHCPTFYPTQHFLTELRDAEILTESRRQRHN